jgi:exosortase
MMTLPPDNVRRYIGLCFLLAISIALWWQAIVSTLGLALSDDAYTHILLIVPLSLTLIYFESRNDPVMAKPRREAGVVLLGIALCLLGLASCNVRNLSSGSRLSMSTFALVTWWIGSAVVCLGLPALSSLLFPLCFLFLIVPLPRRFVDSAAQFLQHQSAVASEILFRAAHVPVTRHGIILSIPALDIEVARECSSIRSSTMLMVITLILAHLFLRSSWRRILLVGAVIPLSVAKNAVRIFTIAELGTRVDPAYLNGRLHHHGGIVFLGLALLVEVAFLWILRRGEYRTLSQLV